MTNLAPEMTNLAPEMTNLASEMQNGDVDKNCEVCNKTINLETDEDVLACYSRDGDVQYIHSQCVLNKCELYDLLQNPLFSQEIPKLKEILNASLQNASPTNEKNAASPTEENSLNELLYTENVQLNETLNKIPEKITVFRMRLYVVYLLNYLFLQSKNDYVSFFKSFYYPMLFYYSYFFDLSKILYTAGLREVFKFYMNLICLFTNMSLLPLFCTYHCYNSMTRNTRQFVVYGVPLVMLIIFSNV